MRRLIRQNIPLRLRWTLAESVFAIGLGITAFVATNSLATLARNHVDLADLTGNASEQVAGLVASALAQGRTGDRIVSSASPSEQLEFERASLAATGRFTGLREVASADATLLRDLNELDLTHQEATAWFRYAADLQAVGRTAEATLALNEAHRRNLVLLGGLARWHRRLNLSLSSGVAGDAASASRVGLWLWLLVFAIVGAGYWLVTSAVRPLADSIEDLGRAAQRVARRDLRPVEISRPPAELAELGRAIRTVASSQRELLSGLQETGQRMDEMAAGLAERAAEVDQASNRIADQADNLTRAAGSEEERSRQHSQAAGRVAKTARQNSESAEESRDRSERLRRLAVKQRGEVRETAEIVRRLATVIQTSADHAPELEALGGRLDEFEGIIQRIASHTDVLDLNASIEAAREGRFGDQIKVIADEVHSLAELSARSADEASEALGKIRDQLSELTTSLNDGRARLRGTADAADTAVQAMEEMVAAAGEMEQGTQKLAREARQQLTAADELATVQREMERGLTALAFSARAAEEEIQGQRIEVSEVAVALGELRAEAERLIRDLRAVKT